MKQKQIDERAEPVVLLAARVIHRKYQGYTTFDDMRQEAYLWCVERPLKVREYMEDGKKGERQLTTALKRRCEQRARKAKAAHDGYDATDEYFMEISQLSELLPFVFDKESWLEQPQDYGADKVSGSRQPSEGGNWMATMIDVSGAYDRLDVDSRRYLRRYYRDDWTFDRIGDAEQLSYHQARREVGQALLALLDELGGASPWTGRDYK